MKQPNGKPLSEKEIQNFGGKPGKHPLSLWRDQSLQERQLEENEGTIFDIIMPWVKEQEADLNKAKTLEQKDSLQKPKGPTQATLSFMTVNVKKESGQKQTPAKTLGYSLKTP